jgi:hypothetical protein
MHVDDLGLGRLADDLTIASRPGHIHRDRQQNSLAPAPLFSLRESLCHCVWNCHWVVAVV